MDGRDRQRRGHRLPGRALPGCRLLGLHGDRQPTGTTFSDPGRSASTSYSYRVRADRRRHQPRPLLRDRERDDAGPARHAAPTAPTNLSATAVSPTVVNLSWTAATDNVAVTGYRVERCQGAGCSVFTEIGQPTGTTFSDPGRSASTSYSYRVRAIDAATNLGPYSATATATTPALPDTTAPTAPTNLSATAVSPTVVNLSWTAATDNVAVTGYRVERCQRCRLLGLHGDRPADRDDVLGSGQKRLDQLLLPRPRDRRRHQPRPLLRDRNRDDAGRCPTRRRRRHRRT